MTAILAIWNDFDAEDLAHFERWYNREHLMERVDTPGFRFGRRYERTAMGDRHFFAFYEVDSPAVLNSPGLPATPGEPDAVDQPHHEALPAHGADRLRSQGDCRQSRPARMRWCCARTRR